MSIKPLIRSSTASMILRSAYMPLILPTLPPRVRPESTKFLEIVIEKYNASTTQFVLSTENNQKLIGEDNTISLDLDDLKTHASSMVDNRIDDVGAEINIFSTLDHSTPNYIRNNNCWAHDINLTCVSVWNSESNNGQQTQTLITRDAIIGSKHDGYYLNENATIRFVNNDNQVITRTVGKGMEVAGTNNDFYISLLKTEIDPDVDGIYPCRVLPKNFNDYLIDSGSSPRTTNIPALCLNQYKEAIVKDLSSAGDTISSYNTLFNVPTDPTRLSFDKSMITGDSGSPAFIIINNQLVLVTTWHYGGSTPIGSSIVHWYDNINTALRTLGSKYWLKIPDLNSFKKYYS